jgi:hypothetical protein
MKVAGPFSESRKLAGREQGDPPPGTWDLGIPAPGITKAALFPANRGETAFRRLSGGKHAQAFWAGWSRASSASRSILSGRAVRERGESMRAAPASSSASRETWPEFFGAPKGFQRDLGWPGRLVGVFVRPAVTGFEGIRGSEHSGQEFEKSPIGMTMARCDEIGLPHGLRIHCRPQKVDGRVKSVLKSLQLTGKTRMQVSPLPAPRSRARQFLLAPVAQPCSRLPELLLAPYQPGSWVLGARGKCQSPRRSQDPHPMRPSNTPRSRECV